MEERKKKNRTRERQKGRQEAISRVIAMKGKEGGI